MYSFIFFYEQDADGFAPALRRYLDREFAKHALYAWGDPAGDRAGQTVNTTPIQVLRAHGIPAGPAPSNDPLMRRSAIAKPIGRTSMDGRSAFLISPTMRMLRKGLQGGFHYRRMHLAGTERYTDEPDKNEFSHRFRVRSEERGCWGSRSGEFRSSRQRPQSSSPGSRAAQQAGCFYL